MAGKGINLAFIADVRDLLKGTDLAEDAIENIVAALIQMAKDGDKAAQGLEQDIEGIGKAAEGTGDKIKQDLTDGINKAGQDGKGKAKEAGSEIGSELAQNIGEGIGSGQGNISDALFGTLGGLVSVPGLGAVAAGIGIGALLVKGVIDGFRARKAEIEQRVQATFDNMDIDASKAIKIDTESVVNNMVDSLSDAAIAIDWNKIGDLLAAGVPKDLMKRVLSGTASDADLAWMDQFIAAHTEIQYAGKQTLQIQDEQAKTMIELKQKTVDQKQATEEATRAKQTENLVIGEGTDETEANTDATNANIDARREAANVAFELEHKEIALARAKQRTKEAADDSKKVSLDERDALLDLAETMQQQDNITQGMRKNFIDNAVAMGYSRGEAKKLADEYGLIPDIKPKVDTSAVDDFIKQYTGKTIDININPKINKDNFAFELNRVGAWDAT